MAKDLEKISQIVLDFVLYLIKHLPTIISMLKTIIALKVGKALAGSLKNVPKLLKDVGDGATYASKVLSKDVWKTVGKNLANGFGIAVTGIKLLKSQLLTVVKILASPAFLAFAVLAGAIAYGVKQNKQWAADAAKSSDNMMERIER